MPSSLGRAGNTAAYNSVTMHITLVVLSLVSLWTIQGLADYHGPSYPTPSDLSSNQSLVAAAWRNTTTSLHRYLNGSRIQTPPVGVASGIRNITFSLGMFSLHDPTATGLQFHYTSPEVANSVNGTKKVDQDSIYRVASITKLFTVLAGLLNLRSADWDLPLTDVFPEFASFNHDAVTTVQWDKVTLSALAAQIAGVPRDAFPWSGGEILLLPLLTGQLHGSNYSYSTEEQSGFPPLNSTDPAAYPACASAQYVRNVSACPATPYVEGVEPLPPTFLPWATPAYSNNGFVLLGLAIANLTGKSLDQLYRESIFAPLNMTSSHSSTPPKSEWYRSVIAGENADLFALDAGLAVASGALLSTTRDLAKFGVGILNSTLLAPNETRRWMKPVSHTSRLQHSVGRPWEILRYTLPSGTVTDIYTKLGDSGHYSGYMVLLPDYGAGFSILSAASTAASARRFSDISTVVDLVTHSIVPSLDAQAATEAERNFGGLYTSTVAGLNSTLALSLNRSAGASPGLTVLSWVSNGTDMLEQLPLLIGPPPYRLQPSVSDSKTGKVAFQLVASLDAPIPAGPSPGLFTQGVSADWVDGAAVTYGGVPLSLFVFDTASNGTALAVSPASLRITLKRAW